MIASGNPSKTVGITICGEQRMKLSTKGRYGLRALIDLAANSEDSPESVVSIQSIARRQDISENYLEQLMRLLKKAGLIISVRGAGGGYRLSKDPAEISVGDVLRALEGDLNPVSCGALEGAGGCDGADSCVTKYVWQRMNDAIRKTVDSIMLSELLEEKRKCADVPVQICSDANRIRNE